MAAALADLPVVHHQDLVRVEDGAEPVRDHQAGAARHQLRDRPLDLRLRLGVHRAGGLVEHQDRRIERERTGEAQELPLAHAQAPAPLAEPMPVPRREPLDEPVGAHPPRGLRAPRPA